MEAQFTVFERIGNSEALRHVFDELVTLYRGVLGQPKRAFELYQRLLGSPAIEPQEIDRVLSWRDIEIRNGPGGRPLASLRGGTQEIAEKLGIRCILVSISHCRTHATAMAIAIPIPTQPPMPAWQ